jgi:hypothetical protein
MTAETPYEKLTKALAELKDATETYQHKDIAYDAASRARTDATNRLTKAQKAVDALMTQVQDLAPGGDWRSRIKAADARIANLDRYL